MSSIHVTFFSEKGKRNSQEDRYLVEKIKVDAPNGEGTLLAVMDGHSGSRVVDLVFKNLTPFFADILIECKGDLFKTCEQLVSELQTLTKKHQEGTTLSMAYAPTAHAAPGRYVLTVVIGDSPIIIRNNDKTLWISDEHNAAVNTKDVERILTNNKKLAKEGGLFFARGCVCYKLRNLQLTRAIGDADFNGIILREPSIEKIPVDSLSAIILASDGVLTSDDRRACYKDIMSRVERGDEAEQIGKWAVENNNGDNVTVLVARLTEC